MEKLETSLSEIPIKEEKATELNPLYNTGYKGLKLITEKVHAAGTSIKYWM